MGKAGMRDLVLKIREGDNTAFDELYRLTNQQAYFIALKITRNETETMDILQDSYLKALERISQLRDPESFLSWFNQIVANTAKNHLCRAKPFLFCEDENVDYDNLLTEDNPAYMPEAALDTAETKKLVNEVIDELPEDKRLCVLLYYFEEMSVPEIAQALGISEGTVKSRLFYSRNKIKEGMERRCKDGTPLYGIAPIALFAGLLRQYGRRIELPVSMGNSLLEAVKGASPLFAGATAAAAAVPAASGIAAVSGSAATGTAMAAIAAKIAAATTATKVIAVAVAGTVVIGGTATGIVVSEKRAARPAETTITETASKSCNGIAVSMMPDSALAGDSGAGAVSDEGAEKTALVDDKLAETALVDDKLAETALEDGKPAETALEDGKPAETALVDDKPAETTLVDDKPAETALVDDKSVKTAVP